MGLNSNIALNLDSLALKISFVLMLMVCMTQNSLAQTKESLDLPGTVSKIDVRVKDILVKGAFPVFKKEVLQVMTISPGDEFSQEVLDQQSSRVVVLFKNHGFIDPKVKVIAKKDLQDGHYIVSVYIEKGDFYRVERVMVHGNHSFSGIRLKLRTKTWQSSVLLGSATRFIEKEFNADVKNLIRFYREKGFADVTVSGRIQKNDQSKTVDLKFDINEGPVYKIRFDGNRQFWDHTLKQEMTLFKDGNKNNFAVKKSIRNIKKKYSQSGFPDAGIKTKITERKKDKKIFRDVTFQTDEGDQYIVSSISIKGNHGVDEKSIKQQILTKPSGFLTDGGYAPEVLEADINAIRVLYLRQGYTRARIQKTLKINDHLSQKDKKIKSLAIELVIDEGPRTRVGTVRFQGLSILKPEAAMQLLSLKPRKVYRNYMIENDENVLKKRISEMGYPHIRVKATVVFNEDLSLADLSYDVDEGPFVTIGQIFYTGNFRTKKEILNKEMTLSQGDPLSLKKLFESRQNMLDMNALNSVKFNTLGLKEKLDQVNLAIAVEEKVPKFVEFATGYDTQRHFYVNTTIGDHNFLGRNLAVETDAELSQIGHEVNVSLTEPRLFSSRISSTTKIAAQKREEFNTDFGIQSYSLSQIFYRQFLEKKLTANVGFQYDFREQYPTQSPSVSETETDNREYDSRHIFEISPSMTYRTTDSYVRPRKGVFSAVYMDISKGIENNLDDYIKYRLDARYYYTVFEPLTLAVRGWYGYIQTYGENKTVPEDQLFFLGGTTTVRGFDENLLLFDNTGTAVGGREAFLGSIEARYDLGLKFEVTLFYDVGRVQKTFDSVDSDDFRLSAGVGLRYMTPIGPVGLVYGWKINPLPGESSGCLHFSMGYTF
ncbi:outer membrane protein assembly factor BamA [Desulfobacula toluolica]|uniref:outer membrane protein assembly factor BamA n=1 Tax=Desulfobacula toluolica TaxID=28223 RepID=UPI0002D27F89|nr:outer membrane protein assembly factor BamA [Desulfobacula toluolica]